MSAKMPVTIYHNSRCSKSRAALAILAQQGIELIVVEYLKNPPSRDELRTIVSKLGIKAEQIVRKGEDVYKERFANRPHSDEQWLGILASNPILIERPIVIRGNRAVIGRPPEKVSSLL